MAAGRRAMVRKVSSREAEGAASSTDTRRRAKRGTRRPEQLIICSELEQKNQK